MASLDAAGDDALSAGAAVPGLEAAGEADVPDAEAPDEDGSEAGADALDDAVAGGVVPDVAADEPEELVVDEPCCADEPELVEVEEPPSDVAEDAAGAAVLVVADELDAGAAADDELDDDEPAPVFEVDVEPDDVEDDDAVDDPDCVEELVVDDVPPDGFRVITGQKKLEPPDVLPTEVIDAPDNAGVAYPYR